MALIQQRNNDFLGKDKWLLVNELYNTVYRKDLTVMLADKHIEGVYSLRIADNAVNIVNHFSDGKRVEMWTGKAGEDHKIVSMDGDVLNLHYIDGRDIVSRDYVLGRKNLQLVLGTIYLPKFMENKNESPAEK